MRKSGRKKGKKVGGIVPRPVTENDMPWSFVSGVPKKWSSVPYKCSTCPKKRIGYSTTRQTTLGDFFMGD